jgi:competence protein ComEC
LVYNAGPRFSSGFDTGRAVVVPYLQRQGVHRIDTLVVSHGDIDHIGGADSLLQLAEVDKIYTSVVERFPGVSAQRCIKTMAWVWDGIHFQFLSPKTAQYSGASDENNLSCVLKVTSPGGQVLLTGDVEKDTEYRLLIEHKKSNLSLDADVLVVPHHGSATSSTKIFIAAVNPNYALLPVGYRNRFGFPKPEVVERYLQNDIELIDTAQWGALHFKISKDDGVVLTERYRESARRYWHSDLSKWYSF